MSKTYIVTLNIAATIETTIIADSETEALDQARQQLEETTADDRIAPLLVETGNTVTVLT